MSGPSDRVALITGAARGVGAATARQLAAMGWNLVLFDVCAPVLGAGYAMATHEELERSVAACGGRAIGVSGDVREQADLDAAVDRAREQFGGLDAALAVAGAVAGGTEGWLISDEQWELTLEINLSGAFRLARAAVPAILERPEPRRGRFLAVASAGATQGLPMMAAYSAAKHGVVGLVRSLAAELGPYGVTANAVAPGSTRTAALEASAALYGLKTIEEFALHHRLPRLVEPEEIGAALAWLCDDRASAVTGALIAVDAGMTSS
jgi:SDR family mycofactocin-dependent oxidoreductase